MLQNIQKSAKELLLIIDSIEKNNAFCQIDKDLLASRIRDLYALVITEPAKEASHDASLRVTEFLKEPSVVTDANDNQKTTVVPLFEQKPFPLISSVGSVPTQDNNDIPLTLLFPDTKKSTIEPKTTAGEISRDKGQSSKLFLSGKLKPNKTPDISKAIAINDKMFFTKQLFGGDNVKYTDTIKELNGKQSLEDAISYLQSLRFDVEDPSVIKLIDLVKRKF